MTDGATDRSDTAPACWLCDRERGDLCHVHDPNFQGGEEDHDPPPVVASLTTEEGPC